jgi:predicted nucleic acid-binding protein
LPEIICNTSPLQYLHQLGALRVFPQLVKTITIAPAVKQELEVGRALGLALPEVENLSWVVVRIPSSAVALPLITDLGAGEREVLALALETPDSVWFWTTRSPAR